MAVQYSIATAFKAVDRVSGAFTKMGKTADNFRNKAGGAFARANKSAMSFKSVMGGIIGANLLQRGFGALTGFVGKFISEARKVEDATAAFTPLLGSVDKAKKLVNRLNVEAATTPFQFQNIADAAKQLLPVMNGDIEKTASTFRMLGDTAGGNAQKLQTITRGFTKAMLKGKVDMEALNMIAEAGVPIYKEMAGNMGITVAELFKLSGQGKLTTKNLTDTFKKMTSEGGIFFNGMIIASKTFSGVMSTLSDTIGVTMADIGQSMLPILKEGALFLIKIAQKVRVWASANRELISAKITAFAKSLKDTIKAMIPIIIIVFKFIVAMFPVIKKLAAAFIIWKVAVWLVNLAMSGMAILGTIGKLLQFVKVVMMIVKAKGLWTAAQWALNIALNANPIGLIVAGIAALIAVVTLLVVYWDDVSAAVMRNADAFTFLLGPIGLVINLIRVVVRQWNNVKSAFTDGGFLAGIMAIGTAMLDFILMPLRGIINLISLIPGLGGIAQSALDAIDRATNVAIEKKEEVTVAPNEAREQARREFGGNANINVTAANGASIESVDDNLVGVDLKAVGAN
jgi:tape measure domain-containing protein